MKPTARCKLCSESFVVTHLLVTKTVPYDEDVGYYYDENDLSYEIQCPNPRCGYFHVPWELGLTWVSEDGWGELRQRAARRNPTTSL